MARRRGPGPVTNGQIYRAITRGTGSRARAGYSGTGRVRGRRARVSGRKSRGGQGG